MKKIIFIRLLITCFLCFVSNIAIAQEVPETFITGGYEIEIEERPFQISLQSNGDHFCGGSILNSKWVITAAHCVINANPNQLDVVVGLTEQDRFNSNSRSLGVQNIIIHPNYNPSTADNDIALLELNTEIDYNNSIQPIRLINPLNDSLINAGQMAYASGWGWTIPGSSSASNYLMGVEIPIISNQEAEAQLDISSPSFNTLTNNMIATGFIGTQRQGPCHGDSGGPLTVKDSNDITYLVGLVSWGVSRCIGGTNSPTVYTNVINYEDWIYQFTCQDNILVDDIIFSDVLIESSNILTSSSFINDDLVVDFKAGQEIALKNGFSYRPLTNGVFHVSIGGNCSDVPASFNFKTDDLIASKNESGQKNNFLAKEENLELKVYPNPFSDLLSIQLSTNITSIQILSLEGEVLDYLSDNFKAIDTSQLKNGLYLLKAKTSSGKITIQKIIKKYH